MALCCSPVCWCCWGKGPSPTYTAKSCSLVRQRLEMGRFHSSLLRLLLTSQEGACQPYQMRLPSWHPHGTQQAAGTMPNFTIAGWFWEATCREVSSSGISVLMRTALSHFRSLCVGKPGEMYTPSPPTHPSQSCGCSWSKESCSPTLLIPCAAAEGANPQCLFWEKLWFCTSQMKQTHRNLSAPHRNSCCQILTDDKLCLTMFNITGLSA